MDWQVSTGPVAAAMDIRIKTELYEGAVQQSRDGRMETNREENNVGYRIGRKVVAFSQLHSCLQHLIGKVRMMNNTFMILSKKTNCFG